LRTSYPPFGRCPRNRIKPKPEHGDSVIINYKAERFEETDEQEIEIRLGSVGEPERPLGLLAGDIVHQLRATLDNSVCLMARKRDPCCSCDKTEFPVFDVQSKDSKKRFESKVQPFVLPDALQAIERLQPYEPANGPVAENPLWLIHRLNVIDKHRHIVVAAKRIRIRTVLMSDGEIEQRGEVPNARWHRMEAGAGLAKYRIIGADRKVSIKPEPEMEIVFEQTGTHVDDRRALPHLHGWIEAVRKVVADFRTAGLL